MLWTRLAASKTSQPALVGSAWAWGFGYNGELGNNNAATAPVNKSSPVSVVGGFTNWCDINGGKYHSAGVRNNGTAWAWGSNSTGNLGDDTTTNRSSPVSVVGGFTDWCQISAGRERFTLGVKQDGTAWGWGCGSAGRLGNNSTTNRSSPVSVVGGFTNWCQVSAGKLHSIGLRQNGEVWTWGRNNYGQLGFNNTFDTSSPVSVVGGFTDWSRVGAGEYHSVALRSSGTIWSWGFGGSGRLGNNCTTNRSSPVSVVGGFTNWCYVAAGDSHSLGIRADGTARAWGNGNAGRLGDGTCNTRSSPVLVAGGFTDWSQVSGGYGSMGLRGNGTAWGWGSNGSGQDGDNTSITRTSPVSVVGGFTDWFKVSVGNQHSLALRTGS